MTTLYSSKYDPLTNKTVNTQTESTVPIIPVDTLTQTPTPIKLPETPVIGTSSNGNMPIITPIVSPPNSNINSLGDYLKNYLSGDIIPPSVADAYTKAQTDSGIIEKQQKVSDLTAKLNAINAEATVGNLGQSDRLTSMGTISGSQASIERQRAIRVLPISAELSAAQGDLTTAQSNLETLFKLKSEDATNLYNYQKEQRQAVYDFATKSEQAKIDTLQKEDDRKFELQKINIQKQNDLAKLAIESGQSSLVSSINGLDTTSPTFDSDIAKLSGQISIAQSTKAPTIQKINGVDMQWNPSTNKWETIGSSTNTPALQLAQAQGNINQISDILKSGGLSSSVGTSFLTRTPTGDGFWGTIGKVLQNIVKLPLTLGVGNGKDIYSSLTGKKQDFISGVQQLQSQLSLDSLIQAKAKGATFGALSEGELNVLSQSASKLGSWAIKDSNGNVTGYNASEKSFKQELDKINNYAKLDYLLKGGKPEDIGATKMSDGTYTTLNSNGTISILNNL